MQRHAVTSYSPLRPLVGRRFQGLFHSSVRGSFHLSLHSTGSLSVSREYLALRDGPLQFTQNFSCPALLRILLGFVSKSCTGLSPSVVVLSKTFHFYQFLATSWSYNPYTASTAWVWAVPRSLATTWESLLFSSPMGT